MRELLKWLNAPHYRGKVAHLCARLEDGISATLPITSLILPDSQEALGKVLLALRLMKFETGRTDRKR
jgi:hypothetical protein